MGTEAPTRTVGPPSGAPATFPTIDALRMVDEANGWAADLNGKLYRTLDGGRNWYLLTTPANVEFNAYASAFLSAAEAWLSFYDANGAPALLRTSDGGATWTRLTEIGLATAGGPASFEFSTPLDGLARVEGLGAGNLYIQIFETHDGGASFSVLPLVGPTDEQGLPEGTLHLCSLCLDAFHYAPARAIILRGDMGSMQPRGGVLVQTSTDLGQHWSEMTLPLPPGYEDALVGGLPLSFPGRQHGFLPVQLIKYNPDGTLAYDAIALYATPDGGATWSLTPTVLSGVDPAALELVDDFDLVALCGSDICVTHDEAHTWQALTPNVDLSSTDTRYVLEMTFVTPSTGWIILTEAGTRQLYRTSDGGATWSLLNP